MSDSEAAPAADATVHTSASVAATDSAMDTTDPSSPNAGAATPAAATDSVAAGDSGPVELCLLGLPKYMDKKRFASFLKGVKGMPESLKQSKVYQKDMGFLTFASAELAARAREVLSQVELKGRLIYVRERTAGGNKRGRSDDDGAAGDTRGAGVARRWGKRAAGRAWRLWGSCRWAACCTDGMILGPMPTSFASGFNITYEGDCSTMQGLEQGTRLSMWNPYGPAYQPDTADGCPIAAARQPGGVDAGLRADWMHFDVPMDMMCEETKGIELDGRRCDKVCPMFKDCGSCQSNRGCGWDEDGVAAGQSVAT